MVTTLIAYGNHGRDLEAIAWRCGIHDLVIYDDNLELGADVLPPAHGHIIVGVNDPIIRRQIAERFKHIAGAKPLIDPSAVVGPDCHFGRGSVVAALAALSHSVSIGKHCHVNTCVSIVRAVVGDYSTISPGATVCGNVVIGEACSVGANATICERVQIGDNVVIGAGAIVPPYSVVPDGAKVIGVYHSK